jgi:hypothetical protein
MCREKLFEATSNDAPEEDELIAIYNQTLQIEKEVCDSIPPFLCYAQKSL